ncbi:MAG: DUF4874 domain-containing protein, partial [Chloroflexota bacterium]
MKSKKTFLCLFFGLIMLASAIIFYPGSAQTTSSTVSYTASDAHFPNPERGFYHYIETRSSNPTPYNLNQLTAFRTDEKITLLYCIHYLDSFVSSPISQSFLDHIESNLETVRQAGLKCILRFAYTESQTVPYGDATKAQILAHINQLQPIFEANVDVIALMHAGFIGAYGEWYYTDHFVDDPALPFIISDAQNQNRRDVLEAEMAALPQDRLIAVRYAHAKTDLFETTTPLNASTAYDGSSFARTTFHNDCFLRNPNDFGTYLDDNGNGDFSDDVGRPFMVADTRYGGMGGESCGIYTDPINEVILDRSACPTALAELAEFHFSYLNTDYFQSVLYRWGKNLTGSEQAAAEAELALFSGLPAESGGFGFTITLDDIVQGNCFETIEKLLGYRLQLIEGTYGNSVAPGGQFPFELQLINVGYAAPFNPRPVELILRNGDDQYKVALPDDPRRWYSNETESLS